jgi:hypothetical protein
MREMERQLRDGSTHIRYSLPYSTPNHSLPHASATRAHQQGNTWRPALLHPLTRETRRPPRASSPSPSLPPCDRSHPSTLSQPLHLARTTAAGNSPCLPKGPIHASAACRRLHFTKCNLWQSSLSRHLVLASYFPPQVVRTLMAHGSLVPDAHRHTSRLHIPLYRCIYVSMHILNQASYPATCISNGERRNGRSAHTPGSVSFHVKVVAIAATDAIVLSAHSLHRPKWAASR